MHKLHWKGSRSLLDDKVNRGLIWTYDSGMEREGQLYNASCSSLIKGLEMEFTSKLFEHQTIYRKKKKKRKEIQKKRREVFLCGMVIVGCW